MIDESKLKDGCSIIFFDGICGLCDSFVQFVLKHAPYSQFLFCSLQSQMASQLLAKYGENNEELETVFVLTYYNLPESRLLKKSKAVLFVLQNCQKSWFWSWCGAVIPRIFPSSLLDKLYDFIASNRYRFLGRYEACMLPSIEWRDRFIDII